MNKSRGLTTVTIHVISLMGAFFLVKIPSFEPPLIEFVLAAISYFILIMIFTLHVGISGASSRIAFLCILVIHIVAWSLLGITSIDFSLNGYHLFGFTLGVLFFSIIVGMPFL